MKTILNFIVGLMGLIGLIVAVTFFWAWLLTIIFSFIGLLFFGWACGIPITITDKMAKSSLPLD